MSTEFNSGAVAKFATRALARAAIRLDLGTGWEPRRVAHGQYPRAWVISSCGPRATWADLPKTQAAVIAGEL